MTDREIMQQALEYIKETYDFCVVMQQPKEREEQLLKALEAALAQPELVVNEKDGSPCPEFWDWLPKAYIFEGNRKFTKYNMEVAFLAGKNTALAQPEQEPIARCKQCGGALPVTDALDVSESLFYDQTKLQEALQAPCELRELKPVAWLTRRTGDGGVVLSGYETCEPTDFDATPVFTAPAKRGAGGAQPEQDKLLVDLIQEQRAEIDRLRQALAQPEQEHKPWCDYLNIMLTSLPPQKAKCNCKQAQPEQKPVEVMQALADNDCAIAYADGWNACVRAHKHTVPPPKRKWVGLTDDDIENLWNGVQWSISDFVIPFTRAIEAKLKEKNA